MKERPIFYATLESAERHAVWVERQPFNDAEGTQLIHHAETADEACELVIALNAAVDSVLGKAE